MKFLNLIIGLLIAIALSALLALGVRAFHPSPTAPNYINMTTSRATCEDKSVDCLNQQKDWDSQYKKLEAEEISLRDVYDQKMKEYSRDIFIIYNIAGVLFFIGGFLITKLLTVRTAFSVGAGMLISGFFAIVSGYVVGWDGTGDRLKFFVGFILFLILIGFSLIIGIGKKKEQPLTENIRIDNHS